MIAMPIAGILMSYVDGRWLISLGVACTAASTLMFGSLTLDVSMASIVWPNVLQGLGLALVLVPLMTISVGRLSKDKIGNASGIFNLMRNLGGSIGISVSTTFLARMAQTHQANLATHMTPYDPVFQARLAALTAGLSRYSAGPQAHMRAYGLLQGILLQQAGLNAYVDMFRWTALIIALCLPGVWLLKKVATKGSAVVH
jgi:DHA2 family multidrug resistance protein